jgi:signal transduction histidine kinase/CheY-like chemotaxis protein/ligand-binding sensor domain-containing protein
MVTLLLLALLPANAGYHHTTWTVAQGLPVDGVSDVTIDRDGRVWVATWDGLVRYDGARFQPVAPDADWPSRRIVQVREDIDGSMWAQVEPGAFVHIDVEDRLSVYPRANLGSAAPMVREPGGRWLFAHSEGVFQLGPSGPALVWPQSLQALTTDNRGQIWALGPGGQILKWNAGTFQPAELPSAPDSWQLAVRDDTFWAGGPAGIVRYQGGAWESLPVDGDRWSPEVRGLAPIDDGPGDDGLWVGTKEGLVRWQRGTATLVPGDTRTPRQNFASTDSEGHAWVAGGQVVLRDGEIVVRFTEGRISDLEVDAAGVAWVGSSTGLHRLVPPRIEVRSSGLTEPGAYAIEVDGDGAWWVGTTAAGVDRLTSTSARHFGPDAGVHSDVAAILAARDGTLWLGTRLHGVLRRNDDVFVADPGPGEGVRVLRQTADGTVYAGANDGLWAWNGTWKPIPGTPPGVRVLVEEQGVLWLGTAGDGLWRLDASGLAQVPVGSKLIRAILPDGRGGAWVGTEDAGLRHTDGRSLGLAEGLPARGVHTLISDGTGGVWGSSNRGLFRIYPLDVAPSVAVFAEPDGLQNPEANGGTGHAARALPDGRLLFATQSGIAVVDPAQIRTTARVPAVLVSSLTVGDVPRRAVGPVNLKPAERTFAVDFGVLGLRDPERTRLAWKLEGLDETWVRGGERRTAYYTAVPPGSYTLRVTGIAADGTPGAEVQLPIHVEPWFWETTPFRAGVLALCALAIAGGVAGGGWWRLAALRRRQAELEALVDARTAALAAEKTALVQAREVVAAQAARLAEVDRLKTRYFANLSHELRTPLTLLLGPLEDVREGRRGAIAPEAREAIGRAERSAKGLFGLVNQLLDVVKIDAGHLQLRREVMDLAGLVRAILADFLPLAARQGLHLSTAVPDAPVLADLDGREFQKVLGNLLSNAIKFTPAGGQIDVTLRAAGGRATLTVRDNGPGISEEGLKRIFDRFYVVEGMESGLQPGTGLGLALAREIVELHGGHLSAQSVAGHGATFVVDLPLTSLVEAEPALRAPSPAPTPIPPANLTEVDPLPDERPAVLVADDHPELRSYIAECLEPRYRVVQAADGLEALQQARRWLPDLLVTDVMMPGMDGNDLVRAIRADPDLDFLPIVMLSARGASEAQLEGLQRGADAYIVKPFSSAVLRAQVDGLLAQRARWLARAGTPAPPEEDVSVDARYERAVRDLIAERHVDPNFGVQELADAMHQDRAHMFRRIKALTGEAPSDLIRLARLEHAARLLARREGNVSEVAYAAGFASLSYFSHAFREHFGIAPSKYAGKASSNSGTSSPP